NSLPRLAVAEWGPLVAVHAGKPSQSFADFLAPLPEHTAAGFTGLKFVARQEYTLACNWKVFVDNYLDGGYHINTIHPGLAGMLDYSQYRTDTYAWTSLQSG